MGVFNDPPVPDSRWLAHRFLISGKPSTPSEISIHTITCAPNPSVTPLGHILLIHGFPETSHQFRHVITPLSDAGYNVIAPDYRGAGRSSRPTTSNGYSKADMAADMHSVVTEHLGISDKIHVVGHDIGGMVAHAYAVNYPDKTASVAWGECPLPGTGGYASALADEMHGGVWHFAFHWQADLPEALVAGRERMYIRSFFDRLTKNPLGISERDTDLYAKMFEQAGALRAGFDVYRGFHRDSEDNRRWVREKGKSRVPCLTLNGDGSFLASIARGQAEEVYERVEVREVRDSGHYIAEENPGDFVKCVLEWVGKHGEK